jgi:catechol 2,3-dioxygenase-like lactoylglutathione lyase family enzyme
MSQPMRFEGVNHVALVCRDMAETVDFYTKMLEMPLVKTLDLPGGRGQHFFFDCGGGGTIAFFWFPNAPAAAPGVASMHPDHLKVGSQTAHASMNHLAISIPLGKFDEYVERLRSKGLSVRVINHGEGAESATEHVTKSTWVRSMYFDDPNGIHMEFAAFTRALTPKDVAHDPVNAKGERVALAVPA